MIEALNELVKILTAKASNLRIAVHEQNDSKENEPEAHEFLKLNEQRLGRDFKVYDFMSQIAGNEYVAALILEEIMLPLKKNAPGAFKTGIEYLRTLSVIGKENQPEWEVLVAELAR